jgi:hypothetical protein
MKKAAATSRQRLCMCARGCMWLARAHQRFIFPEFEGDTQRANNAFCQHRRAHRERECSADFTFFGPQGMMLWFARLFCFAQRAHFHFSLSATTK